MIDKPIGGHGNSIDSYETAALHECMDELNIPATVLSTSDFSHAVRYRPEILSTQAVLMNVRQETNYRSVRAVKDGEPEEDIVSMINAEDFPKIHDLTSKLDLSLYLLKILSKCDLLLY